MPQFAPTPKRVDTNAFLVDWLDIAILPDSCYTFKPRYRFETGQVAKIIEIERRSPTDGSYRLVGGLKVVISDANHLALAVLSPESIAEYERTERDRVTRLLNAEVLIYEMSINMMNSSQVLDEYDYKTDLPIAVFKITKFAIFNRDRYALQSNQIPYIYWTEAYRDRYRSPPR